MINSRVDSFAQRSALSESCVRYVEKIHLNDESFI